MRNLRPDICFDGTRYKGWQRLPGVENTVQGKLEQTLSRILGVEIEIAGSGRTEAGAHAKCQTASFRCESDMPCEDILFRLRRYLPEDIGIYSCKEAAPRFHARLNAKRKTYCYRIWNSEMPCVFDRRFVYAFPEALDVEVMRRAAEYFLGEHDFSAFCANKKMKKSTVRRIDSLEIERIGEEIRITVTGNGFLYNMVRIMVGTLIEVGLGQRQPDSIPALFGAKRENAGFLVPAQGLCLMEVTY
ncbi:MAG: tRNA pseudouridine(38-40) synthase TruA [Oscillospiraceae bacterium]|nr:tRNA pseudouridine(38-40) synthase TruA [Oscillospiraceae bacterium]